MKSTIVHKAWMALTGVFLVLFLIVHMLGNLQLFLPESVARTSFNAYSAALTSSLVIKFAGWMTYASVVAHVVVSAILTVHNRGRRTHAYAVERASVSSPWYTRSMGWLGAVILAFLVWHMLAFWYRYHWGPIGLDEAGNKDLYAVVVTAFCEPWIVIVYVACMVAVGYHLHHGLAAAPRSLGVFGASVASRTAGLLAWSIAVPFALMPIYIYVAFRGQPP